MEYKKSYWGFWVWMFLLIVMMFGVVFLPIEDYAVIMRLICNIITIGMAVLTYIIYKTEYIYWYTGLIYEEALEAGSERRKAYAWKYFKTFGIFAAFCFVFTLIAQIMNISYWVDFVVVTVGIVAVAISTIRFKL